MEEFQKTLVFSIHIFGVKKIALPKIPKTQIQKIVKTIFPLEKQPIERVVVIFSL